MNCYYVLNLGIDLYPDSIKSFALWKNNFCTKSTKHKPPRRGGGQWGAECFTPKKKPWHYKYCDKMKIKTILDDYSNQRILISNLASATDLHRDFYLDSTFSYT